MSDLREKIAHKLLDIAHGKGKSAIEDADEIISLCQPQWISVDTDLPEDGVQVFAGNYDSYGIYAYCYIDEAWFWCNCYNDITGDPEFDDDYRENITHWYPIISRPPEESK